MHQALVKGESLLVIIFIFESNMYKYSSYYCFYHHDRYSSYQKYISPKERTIDQKVMLLQHQRNDMLKRRRGRRRDVFMSLGKKDSNYANSTLALWPMRDDEDTHEVFVKPLVATWNVNYYNDDFDDIDELHENVVTNIDEICPCKFMMDQNIIERLGVYAELILWSKFNAQLLTPGDNRQKHAKVDKGLLEEILGKVQEFYLDHNNQKYAINIVNKMIATQDQLQDEDEDNIFCFSKEEWIGWYNNDLVPGYNYDQDKKITF